MVRSAGNSYKDKDSPAWKWVIVKDFVEAYTIMCILEMNTWFAIFSSARTAGYQIQTGGGWIHTACSHAVKLLPVLFCGYCEYLCLLIGGLENSIERKSFEEHQLNGVSIWLCVSVLHTAGRRSVRA